MQVSEIKARLSALVRAMTEKGIVGPYADFTIKGDSQDYVYLSGEGISGGKFLRGDIEADLLAAADAFVAALPDPREASVRRYMEQVAKTVEVGRAENIPDQYVVPFREVLTAMTENLLPAPKAEVA